MAAKGVGSTPGAPAMDSTSGNSNDVIIIVDLYPPLGGRGGEIAEERSWEVVPQFEIAA